MINTNLKKSRVWALVLEDVGDQEFEIGREMTKNEVINYLFGSSESNGETPLDIYVMDRPAKTVTHRLNMLWAFPLTLICAPYMWIKRGEIGWHNKTKVGRFVLKCVGEDS